MDTTSEAAVTIITAVTTLVGITVGWLLGGFERRAMQKRQGIDALRAAYALFLARLSGLIHHLQHFAGAQTAEADIRADLKKKLEALHAEVADHPQREAALGDKQLELLGKLDELTHGPPIPELDAVIKRQFQVVMDAVHEAYVALYSVQVSDPDAKRFAKVRSVFDGLPGLPAGQDVAAYDKKLDEARTGLEKLASELAESLAVKL